MRVMTNAYSVPANLMKRIRRNNDLLANILEPEEKNPDWKVENYDFDKGIESYLSLLRAGNCVKTAKYFDCETFFYSESAGSLEYDSYDVWAIPPSKVKAVSKELDGVTLESLTKSGVANEVSDRRNWVIPEDQYPSYFGDIEQLKEFVKTAAELGHYLIFAEA